MDDKEIFIKKIFNTIADDYDRMNLILTGGFFPYWQNKLLKEMHVNPKEQIIDICCGSGELTIKIANKLDKSSNAKIVGIDFSKNMLKKGKEKVKGKDLPIEFYYQDALSLEFADQSFDKALNSFALRNLDDIDIALSEMWRVLKNRGSLYILEVSKPENNFIRFFFEIYYYKIVPIIGKMSDKGEVVEGKYSPYGWLSESLKHFPEKKEIVLKFYNAGFKKVKVKTFGFGAISLYIADK